MQINQELDAADTMSQRGDNGNRPMEEREYSAVMLLLHVHCTQRHTLQTMNDTRHCYMNAQLHSIVVNPLLFIKYYNLSIHKRIIAWDFYRYIKRFMLLSHQVKYRVGGFIGKSECQI